MTCSNRQYSQIQLRRGSNAEFIASDPVLASGEPAYAVDVKLFKIGDGLSPWNSLSGIYLDTSLTQFSPVSSNTFASLITDETGSGLVVFNTSPTFTGIPLAPTAASGTNSNQIATTSFVRTEVANLVDSAPSVLDTLNELAAAINDDASFYVTINNNINSVSGSIPFVTNSGDNRIVTSDGTNRGINGESNLTFDGTLLSVSGNLVARSGTLDILSFNTNNGLVSTQGQIGWNNTEGTVDIAIENDLAMQVNEHRILRVRNTTSSTLYKGQVVYASGVHANGIITPNLYVADGSIQEIRFIGMMLADVNNNHNGFAIDFGHINNIDTRGNVANNYAVGDETWADGDILYVHPTVAGKLTKVEPKHAISVAYVLDAANNGKIFARPTNFGDINQLHDVNTSGATNGQFLQYNSVTDYWVPSSSGNFTYLALNGVPVATGAGTTITNAGDNRILTSDGTSTGINGESNLSFDGSILTVSGTVRLGDTAGNRVQFFKGGGAIYDYSIAKEGNHLAVSTANDGSTFRYTQFGYHSGSTWTPKTVVNNYNGNVGIATTSPSYTLHVVGSGYFNGFLDVDNIRVDGNTISSTNTNGNIVLAPNGTGDVQVDADTLRVGDSNSAATITTNGTGNLTVNTNGGTNSGSIVINQGSNGNIAITPNGTGEVDLSKVDIDGGSIDNTAIGATTASTGKFKQLYPTVISNGTVSGSVGTDVSTGQIFDMTLSGATTLSNPTNAVDGVTVRWRITQDGTGGHTVALGSEFQIPSSASSPLPWSTAANATDILAATYHAGRTKWDVVAFVPGY